MTDPLNYMTTPPSTVVVKVVNTSREDMNGELGIVTSYSPDRGRYVILMVKTQSTTALKPENTTRASTLEQYQAQYYQLTRDPRIRQSLLRFEAQYLPTGVTLKMALMGVAGVLFTLVVLWGFTRTVTLISLLLLLGSIAAPDLLQANASSSNRSQLLSTCARNFPTRCRETVERTVPAARGKVSNNMAFGLVVVLVLWIGRSLFAGSAAPKQRSVEPPLSAKTIPKTPPPTDVSTMKDYYNLGFNDALDGKPHGSSWKEPVPMSAASSRSLNVEDDMLDYDYVPQPAPKTSKLGFSTAMSCFFLFRTAKELGTGTDGAFNYQVALANARTMEPWKMGIAAFSLFNVFRSFM